MIELYHFTTTEDGVSTDYRWTSGPESVSWNSQTWTPKPIGRSSIKVDSRLDGGELTVELERSSPIVSAFHQDAFSEPISLTIYKGDPDDLAGTVETLWMGEVAKVRRSEPAKLTCAPVVTVGRRQLPVGRFTRECRWQLYSDACGVDPDSLSVRSLFSVDTLYPDAKAFDGTTSDDLGTGWANGGIYWESSSGIELFVLHSVLLSDNGDGTYTHRIYLKQWPEQTINTSMSVYLKAGCDHTMSDCKTKFSNLHNYGGFPLTPDNRDLSRTFGVES